jgi:ABC-type antimicrobial peptide transport system permease subunit
LALGLAALGLYGLLGYVVAERSHEIGVRKALGAADGVIIRMVLRGALGVSVVGVAAGTAGALALSKVVKSQLYGVSPHDPRIIIGSGTTLLLVAVLAALASTRRATRVDPMVTLRAD